MASCITGQEQNTSALIQTERIGDNMNKEVRIIVEVRDSNNIYNDKNLYNGGVKKKAAIVHFDSDSLEFEIPAGAIDAKLNHEANKLIKAILKEVKES